MRKIGGFLFASYSGLTFGNFRMYAEERGLTFGVGGTPVDKRRLKSQTSKRQRLLNVSFKKRTRKRRNLLVSSFVGRLKVCTHTPNFKMSQTFECFFKKRSYKRRNVLVSRSSTTKSLHTHQTSKRRRLLNVSLKKRSYK